MSVTIYDIADQAEVSIATVSRVFNGSPRVSPRTRERVLRVARALHYQPNVSAQSLARQSTSLIAAVIPFLTNYFYMEVLRGMQDALAESDFDLLVYSAQEPKEVDRQLDRALRKGLTEGLLLLSTPLSDKHVDLLDASEQPIGLIDAHHPRFDSVTVDNIEGGYVATRHLIERGRQRIAFIGLLPEAQPVTHRREGYERALREAGRTIDPALVVTGPYQPRGSSEEGGYRAMGELLEKGTPPDAVFAASDVQAVGAMHALQKAGLDVPGDVALVGFDDVKLSQYVGLTTLRQPMYEMGHLGIEKLLRRIEHSGRPPSPDVFTPCLVTRRSTATA